MAEADTAAITSKREIWRYYGEYCANTGLIAVREGRFFSELTKRVYCQDVYQSVKGVRIHSLQGIRLKLPDQEVQVVQGVYTQSKIEKLGGIDIPAPTAPPTLVRETLFETMKRIVDVVEVNRVVSAEFVAGEVKLSLLEVERLLKAAQVDRVVWCDVNGLWRFSQ
jgi:hypothetical protein